MAISPEDTDAAERKADAFGPAQLDQTIRQAIQFW
jgi:hypothetical protein